MRPTTIRLVYPAAAVALCALITACSKSPPENKDEAADSVAVSGPRPSPETVASAVDSLAQTVVAQGLAPALGVSVVMDGRTILARSYGLADATKKIPATDTTLWYVASTSKSYTGFGTALLAYQHVIDFRTPIKALLPNARWPEGIDPAQITLANFLSHTHGLSDNAIVMSAAFTAEFPEKRWPEMLRYAKPGKPGTVSYSNLGYNVAAMVIDAKRPEGWKNYLDSAVYKPAGMNQTYTRVSGLNAERFAMPHELRADGTYATRQFDKVDATMNSAGGHLATMHDLARWITVQMDSGVIDGERVFPAGAVALSQTMIAKQTREESRSFLFFRRDGWGSGWDIGSYRGERMISRFGSYASLRSHLSFLPNRRIGVVAQTNGQIASQVTDIIAAFAYDLERGIPEARRVAAERMKKVLARRSEALIEKASDDSARAARRVTLKRSLADFAGTYRNESYGTVVIEVRKWQVFYKWGAVGGPAEIIDARTCGWLGCRYYNALIIDMSDNKMGVDFEFPETGPAVALKLRGERFVRQ